MWGTPDLFQKQVFLGHGYPALLFMAKQAKILFQN